MNEKQTVLNERLRLNIFRFHDTNLATLPVVYEQLAKDKIVLIDLRDLNRETQAHVIEELTGGSLSFQAEIEICELGIVTLYPPKK